MRRSRVVMRHGRAVVAAAAVIGVGLAVLVAPVARADAPSAVGWWLDRDENVPDDVVPPPDVPSGGLYVSGTLTGPQAVSAVRYSLEEGATPESLTLAVASSSGTVVLDACPPASPWQPAARGTWDARPEADCGDDGSRRVTGTVAADASTVTFALSDALVTNGLDLVLVPGVDPATSTTAVFDAAFEAPGAASLSATAPPAAGAAEAESAPATTAAPAARPSPSASSSATVQPGPAPVPEPASRPAASSSPSSSSSDASLSASGGGDAFDAGGSSFGATANGPLEMSGGRRAAAIAIVVVMLALLAWVNRDALLARAASDVTGSVAVLPPSPSERVVGVGRFARPRKGPTPPL